MSSSGQDNYNDDPSEMTASRRLARYLSQFKWYNPNLHSSSSTDHTSSPSLDVAWARYEHFTLPRYIVHESKKNDLVRALPGEERFKTLLYPTWRTPNKDLSDFGIGVRMYFTSLIALASILFMVGLLNLPLLHYFMSSEYSLDEKVDIKATLRASAICTEYTWVPCQDCNQEPYRHLFPSYRINGTHVMRNNCHDNDFGSRHDMINYVSFIVLIICFIIFFLMENKVIAKFDEDQQTASDFSIVVKNPPKDAKDPKEWRDFFAVISGDHVHTCTISLNNQELIQALVYRRKLIKLIKKMRPDLNDKLNNEIYLQQTIAQISNQKNIIPRWKIILESIGLFSHVSVHLCNLKKVNSDIYRLKQKEYNVTHVFVTLETEKGQRCALTKLNTGNLAVWTNSYESLEFKKISTTLNPSNSSNEMTPLKATKQSVLKFRREHILNVQETWEPNETRWQDLKANMLTKCTRIICAYILCLLCLGLGAYTIKIIYDSSGVVGPALAIAIFNALTPNFCNLINKIEFHKNETNRQTSLYIKIVILRWFFSAIVITAITDFVNTISLPPNAPDQNLLYSVYAIFYAEMVTIPMLQILDIGGKIKMHYLAPRAKDQESMNLLFTGSKYQLAERYTDVTKIIFMTFFFSAIIPQSYFLGSTSLIIHFLFGKFCLVRSWAAAPSLGTKMATFSHFFFLNAICAGVSMSAYWWSGYPYDNVCVAADLKGEYIYCNQDLLRSGKFPFKKFLKTGGEWMTTSQIKLTLLFSWSAIVIIFLVYASGFISRVFKAIKSICYGSYEPFGEDQGINFSHVKHLQEVTGFLPQIIDKEFEFPLLLSDISGFDEDLIGWRDPLKGFESHNLIHDLPSSERVVKPNNPVFSIVKYWPISKIGTTVSQAII